MVSDNKNEIKWYDSANIITTLIILVICLILVSSQSFALGKYSSIELFTSIINHNSIYLCILVYFVLLKFYIGKRYFNYLSVLIVFIYFITTITSFLTFIQSFSLTTILDFFLNTFIFIYLVHTLLRDTRLWREFYISKSPFNEITNDVMFYIITVISLFLLAVNLVNTTVMSGVILSILDTVFVLLLSRYIYLYRRFLENKKIGVENTMNLEDIGKALNEIDKKVTKGVDKAAKKVDDFVKENEIDKKIDKAKDKVVETTKEMGKQIEEIAKDTVKDIKKATKKGDK